MTEQPLAVQLADALDKNWEHRSDLDTQASDELRRLHSVNDDLLGLLKEARKIIRASSQRNLVKDWDRRATAAISKATGERQ